MTLLMNVCIALVSSHLRRTPPLSYSSSSLSSSSIIKISRLLSTHRQQQQQHYSIQGAATAATDDNPKDSDSDMTSSLQTTQSDKIQSDVSYQMTDLQKYLFDTSGYIIIKNVYNHDEVAVANQAIDHHMHTLHERTDRLRCSNLYGRCSDKLAGDGVTGRFDMGGMLGWDAPYCEPFRNILAHPRLIPVLHELVGTGYRLDHSPLLILMKQGSEGHTLHGGAVGESGEPAWNIAYECRNKGIRNQLLTVCLQLTNTQPGDGGFCILPGSHKSNFPVPPTLADYDDMGTEYVVQPTPQAGDVLIFTEAALHGTLPWTNPTIQRRTVIYRFSPSTCAYGRGYFPSWPEKTLQDMSPSQLSVMQAPYTVRLNRSTLDHDGEVVLSKPRESFKVEFDERVFGSKYY